MYNPPGAAGRGWLAERKGPRGERQVTTVIIGQAQNTGRRSVVSDFGALRRSTIMSLKEPIERTRTVDEGARTRADFERNSTEELLAGTLEGEYDDDAPWEAVSVLRLRGGAGVFEVAKRYCTSEDAKARARGLSVLAQLD